jgi:hypothetical protein
MSKPKDQKLYDSIKKKVYNDIPNHSAYRSGILVQKYKEAYKKKYNSDDAYEGTKNKEGLERWFKEDWRNQRGEVGYKKKGDVYRPTKRINEKTPTTFKELSQKEIKKAMEEKRKTGRVKKF